MGQSKWPEPKSKVLKATRENNSAFMRNFGQRKGKFLQQQCEPEGSGGKLVEGNISKISGEKK